jgi:hypothetical protein
LFAAVCGAVAGAAVGAGAAAGFVCGACVVPVTAGLSVTGVAGRFSCFAGCTSVLPVPRCGFVLLAGDGCLLPSASGLFWALLSVAEAFCVLLSRFCPEERLRPPRRPRLDPRFC